jgi:hypothetical protein
VIELCRVAAFDVGVFNVEIDISQAFIIENKTIYFIFES